MSSEMSSQVETRPLSFFLQRRAKEQELIQKTQKRKERIEKKKSQEEERRKTLHDKRKRNSRSQVKKDLPRLDVFLDHSKKHLVSALKILDSFPSEFKSSKEVGFLSDMTRRLEHFQKQMLKKARKIEDLEEQDKLEERKHGIKEKQKESK